MKASDLAQIICAYAEESLSLPFTVYTDLIPDADGDGACIRHDPSPAAERRFLDGTRLVCWALTFYVRCADASDARDYAKSMADLLDGAELEESGSGIRIHCEAVTLPQYIETDSKGMTTYSASVSAEYTEEI